MYKKLSTMVILMSAAAICNATAFNYSENFNSVPNGNIPTDWTLNSEGSAQVQSGVLGEDSSQGFIAYSGSQSNLWGDYTVRAEMTQDGWTKTTSSWFGMMAHVQQPFGGIYNTAHYGLRWQSTGYTSDPVRFQLYKADTNGNYFGLGYSANCDQWSAGEMATVEIDLSTNENGVAVIAKIWMDDSDPDTDAADYTASYLDQFDNPAGGVAPYTSGTAGLIWRNFNSYNSDYDNFEVSGQLVPEPTTLAIIAAGALLVRRKRII